MSICVDKTVEFTIVKMLSIVSEELVLFEVSGQSFCG